MPVLALTLAVGGGCDADDPQTDPTDAAGTTTNTASTSDTGAPTTAAESTTSGPAGGDSSGSDETASLDESSTGQAPTGDDPRLNAPSCDGLDEICADESCCTSIAVPGGTFSMGRSAAGNDSCDDNCFSDETPEHEVRIDAYELDKYTVTVGRFRRFVEAWNDNWRPEIGAGAHPSIPGSGWQASWDMGLSGGLQTDLSCGPFATWTDEPGDREDRPIVCVNWYQAQAFCIWDEGRLPTEAEWEFAAAGGEENRLYPWGGAPIDETRSVIDADDIEPVGTKPDGAARWGHLDLAGNVGNWAFDCFDGDFYGQPEATQDNAANVPMDAFPSCAAEINQDTHATRGGGADSNFITYNRAASRGGQDGSDLLQGTSFRCVR